MNQQSLHRLFMLLTAVNISKMHNSTQKLLENSDSTLRRCSGVLSTAMFHVNSSWRQHIAAYVLMKLNELNRIVAFEVDENRFQYIDQHYRSILHELIKWTQTTCLYIFRVNAKQNGSIVMQSDRVSTYSEPCHAMPYRMHVYFNIDGECNTGSESDGSLRKNDGFERVDLRALQDIDTMHVIGYHKRSSRSRSKIQTASNIFLPS